ncbi:hypothetical protein KRP22_003568 [Phytophthora ramorum]|nr:hypothetical protein KRP22_9502 [Phytophthora ramorum]
MQGRDLSIKQASRVECIPIGPNPVSYQKVCPQSIRDWVRDHCMEEVARSVTIRQNFAVEKLYIIFSKHCYQAKHRRFSRWLQQVTWMQCDEQIRRFCRLKCALWVLQKSRKKLEKLVFCLWSRWMVDTVHQREDETIAAAVTIQSWKSTLSRAIGRESVGQVDFGRRWQSEVYDLGVVMIDAADAIIAVGCVFRCDLAPIPDSSLVCSRGVQHTFVLMKHEFIERLHVRTSANTLVSLKIWTNLRSSQWFGGTGKWQDHDHYNVEEIAAPQGWYVSSFYGSHVGQRCNQLGCRFDLLSRSSRMDPIQVDLSKQQSKTSPVTIREADIDGKPFFYSHMQLQAVAITCSSHLRAISIVSDEQYNRYLRDRESALGPNEHLLELIAGERIQRVDVCHSSSALVGLRLTTTLRTTQWFGSADSGSITSLSSEQGYVCGFFGTRDTSGICSLGAVCQLETPPQDASKDIARWDAMRDELLPVKFPTSF